MSIPKDTTAVAPKDVEAHHVAKAPMDESQATAQHDSVEDVDAHSCRYEAEQGDGGKDVEDASFRGI